LADLEKAISVPLPRFVEKPPLSPDDGLQFESVVLPGGVPLVASRFDVMPGAHTGVALRLDGVPREQLRYVSLMPELLTEVGVIVDGRPLSFEMMSERLRHEVLSLRARLSTDSGVELVLTGSGLNLKESRAAMAWMERSLYAPDWSPANLPRIRDVVDQQLAKLRNTAEASESDWNWVRNPARAWRNQHKPAWLAGASFLTRTHNALRLRWQLMDSAAGNGPAWEAFLTQLADTGRTLDRSNLKELLTAEGTPGWDGLSSDQKERARKALDTLGWSALSPEQRAVAAKVLPDLHRCLDEMPDTSLGDDFFQLTLTLRDDLSMPPSQTLQELDATRRGLLCAGGARMFLASSRQTRDDLDAPIKEFALRLNPIPFVRAPNDADGTIRARLRTRGADASAVHVGLRMLNMERSAIDTSATLARSSDWEDKDNLLDFLAASLYTGSGSHSAYSRTGTASLAYSNGLSSSLRGSAGYYADHVTDLPALVRFVVGIVKDATPDPALGEYVIAHAFAESRATLSYEERAEGIAKDLANGQPPDLIRRARSAILELRHDAQLMDKLYDRKDRVHARILPGYDPKSRPTERNGSFVIGPDQHLDAWEDYLKEVNEVDGIHTHFQRLYGRDFWMT
jgi:hypothetical protein